MRLFVAVKLRALAKACKKKDSAARDGPAEPARDRCHRRRCFGIIGKQVIYHDEACLKVQMEGNQPDVVLHEAHEPGSQLLVEVLVTHRTEQRQINIIRDRRLTPELIFPRPSLET